MLAQKELAAAKERLKPYIYETPMIRLQNLDDILGCQVYIKADCMQKTNSFKIRGALNKMLKLTPEQLNKGVLAISSGNHGKAVAYVAKMLGARCLIVLPDSAPEIKRQAIRDLDSELVICPFTERQNAAKKLLEEHGYTIIPPYDDYDIIAGQGTAGLEISQQLPDVNAVIVPIGGGGLISGISFAIKKNNSGVKVYGAEPAVLGRYYKSIRAGELLTVPQQSSIADAILTLAPGQLTLPIVKENVDCFPQVEEEYIKQGAKMLLRDGKVMCEPSSGIVVGAALQGILPVAKTDKVCFFISGGNASLEQITAL